MEGIIRRLELREYKKIMDNVYKRKIQNVRLILLNFSMRRRGYNLYYKISLQK